MSFSAFWAQNSALCCTRFHAFDIAISSQFVQFWTFPFPIRIYIIDMHMYIKVVCKVFYLNFQVHNCLIRLKNEQHEIDFASLHLTCRVSWTSQFSCVARSVFVLIAENYRENYMFTLCERRQNVLNRMHGERRNRTEQLASSVVQARSQDFPSRSPSFPPVLFSPFMASVSEPKNFFGYYRCS